MCELLILSRGIKKRISCHITNQKKSWGAERNEISVGSGRNFGEGLSGVWGRQENWQRLPLNSVRRAADAQSCGGGAEFFGVDLAIFKRTNSYKNESTTSR